ncbi:MAG TPA: rhomboid family intramembrane serine protease [Clostridia bacterium]|nr:rhomboid family intramembrane serine protease [Clostridia bacterium]
MNLEDRYINAVSARLIDEMAFSVLEVEGQPDLAAIVRRRGESLELLFFIADDRYYEFIDYRLLPGVREYMRRMNCSRAWVVNVFLGGYRPVVPVEDYSDIILSNIRVDIEAGSVLGETYGLEKLEQVLLSFADTSKLERHNPVDLKTLNRFERDTRPVVTRAIIAINILMWILMTLAGGSTDVRVLIRFGAMYAPLVMRGQYWRFVTPMFLHVGLAHLAFNSYALYQLGGIAERVYGRYRFAVIYGAAGICGSVFSFLFTRAVSAGASGAIFGMLGAILYFARKRPGVFRKGFMANLLTILAINIFIGLSTPGIDNFAHMGGFLGGYTAARFAINKPAV